MFTVHGMSSTPSDEVIEDHDVVASVEPNLADECINLEFDFDNQQGTRAKVKLAISAAESRAFRARLKDAEEQLAASTEVVL